MKDTSKSETWTGERLETYIFNNNTIEHLHRYAFAIELVKDKTVLDIASGEGYGSNLLCKYATKVYGVDIDEISIKNARKKYRASNLEFKQGSVDAIPLTDQSIDVALSFETLEHHSMHDEMLIEIKRILKPDGILVISTPDKRNYTDERNYHNSFHKKELYKEEFKNLMKSHFQFTQFYFQKMSGCSLIISEQDINEYEEFEGDFSIVTSNIGFKPMYIIAIAGKKGLPYKRNLSSFNGGRIVAREFEQLQSKVREDTARQIETSWNFRIGRALLSPIRFFKHRF